MMSTKTNPDAVIAYSWLDAFIGKKKPPVVKDLAKKRANKAYIEKNYEKVRERERVKMKKKYQEDPEWRAKKIEYERGRRHKATDEQKAAKLLRQKQRVIDMTEDEYIAFRANASARSREYRARVKAKKALNAKTLEDQ